MPGQINKDLILKPGTVDEVLRELQRISTGYQTILNEIKSQGKSLFDQWGKPLQISGENIQQLSQAKNKVDELTNAEIKVKKQLTEVERAQRALNVARAKANPEIIKLTAATRAQAQANREAVIQQQKLTGTYKAGYFSGLINQVKGLAAAYLGLQGAIGLVSSIFTTTKELNVLSQSYKFLIKDSNELADTQTWLSDITERYGLNVLATSQSYLKFRASIQGSNLEVDKARGLFESLAKAGSVLGLSVERMDLIFLALEQMISKGTVSTEELRRQLGDNLYGALQIMADAVGVSVSKLLEMIKANKILATEWLPKFGDQVEKAYGIENVKRIDNMQTAINRFKNEWIRMVDNINASKFSQNVINFFTKILKAINSDLDTDIIDRFNEKISSITDNLKSIKDKDVWSKTVSENIQITSDKVTELGLKIVAFKQKWGRSETDLFSKQKKELTEMTIEYEAQKKIRNQLYILQQQGFKITKEEKKIAEDETLTKLQYELSLATGIIEKLEAKKALNDYLIKKSKDTSEITKLIKENDELERQLKILSYIPNIVKETSTKFEKNSSIPAFVLEGEKMFELIDDRNEKIKQNREQFWEEIGGIDQVNYKNELQFLKEFHDQEKLTDEQYLLQRASLWMKYNKDYIDAANNFAQEILNVFSEINAGRQESLQREISESEDKLSKLKGQLDEEKKLKDEGKANDYDRLVTQIAEQQAIQKKANKEMAKLKKEEAAIQLASQASDIATSAANIISSASEQGGWVGAIAGLALVASLIASWVSYKNKIDAIGKYAKGEVDIDGKPHSQGGKVVEIEGGESIIKKDATAQSKKLLTAINEGKITDSDLFRLNFSHNLNDSNYQRYDSTSEMLSELRASRSVTERMAKHFEETPTAIQLSDGRILLQYGKYNTKIVTLRK